MPKSNKKKAKSRATRKQYQLGGLYEAHFPRWNIYSNDEAIVDQWEWITNVRYKTGEYVPRLGAYPIYMTEHANTNKSLTVTRIYIPARYRPLLRLLNFKQAWLIYSLSMPEPRKPKKPIDGVTPHGEVKRRYEVWFDGLRRNIIYCDSIRNSFFEWIEETYYKGSNATDIEPRVKSMEDNKSCNLLENWFLHEVVIQSHIPSAIHYWNSDKKNKKFIRDLRDVLNIGMAGFTTIMSLTRHSHLDYEEWGKDLAWYGRILDPENEDDKRIIAQQKHAGLHPHPVEEDIDAVRRGYGPIIRTFFDTLMNDPHANHVLPVSPFCIKSVNIFFIHSLLSHMQENHFGPQVEEEKGSGTDSEVSLTFSCKCFQR